ncbi:MAG: sulfite exporter TauE/SafE family protein [Humidesulfovibrio sp.]|uniref:sulfite exporter TauE/SafE family protein n=1 Tax=Humidesulfovibrio sp. TaxID=2910988 RepID=UPI0027F9700C|nr:sulfite exporter TauE/SafE family protein [Humidesulfovibrio sp.]MDQ7835823.1 sulfite exporter TauE/SafE family protein [Humidesulfovibrio sp.]
MCSARLATSKLGQGAEVEAASLGLVAAAALLAGFTQAFAGFGSTLVAMPLLALVLGVRAAVPLGCLMALSINVLLVARLGRQAHGLSLVLLLAAALPGMVLGFLFQSTAPEALLKFLLGSCVVVLALRLSGRGAHRYPLGRRWAVAAGIASGCMGVSLGINGPPVVSWAVCQTWSRDTLKATLTAYFLCAGSLIVAMQFWQGLMNNQVLALFAKTLPLLLAGMCAGWMCCDRVSESAFRRVVLALLATTGLALLWQALGQAIPA